MRSQGRKGLSVKRFPVRMQEMPNSKLVERLRLAREALLLVSQGRSERSAVSRIASADPPLRYETSSALKLVIDTVSRLDSLSRAVLTIFPGEKFDRKSLALFHLTANLMLPNDTDAKADLVRTLRRISSEREGPKLEQLLGFLIARAPLDNWSDMTETEQVGLHTHNPPWWVQYCFYHFGRETGLKILSPPARPRYVRVNPLRNRGRITSVDYSRNRMGSWRTETERLGVKIASPLIGDASDLGLTQQFDLVIVDPPCTGTGILDRNPRMKWHLSPKLVQKFSLLQFSMLEESSRYTRPGGRILYCTCSLTLEENEFVLSRFLSAHADFETRPILEEYGSPGLRGQNNCRRFYPHRDRTAGYFIARLERSQS